MKAPTKEQLMQAQQLVHERSLAMLKAGMNVPDEIAQIDKLMKDTALYKNTAGALDLRISQSMLLSAALTAAFELGVECTEIMAGNGLASLPANTEVQ